MSTAAVHFRIDGSWIGCQPGDDFGAIGIRYRAVLGMTPGQPHKNLLLRYNVWPPETAGSPPQNLTLQVLPNGSGLGLRPISGKKYQEAFLHNGVQKSQGRLVFQQDISGLVSLRQAVLQALANGQTQHIWQLFYQACEALDRYGRLAGAAGSVLLQCPSSLVVGPGQEIVLLDAEIRPDGPLSQASAAGRLYQAWFGAAGAGGFVDVGTASLLHAQALLQYFRQILADAQREGTPHSRGAAAALAQAEQIPVGQSLAEVEDWLRGKAEDWNLWVEDDDSPSAPTARRNASPLKPQGPRGRRSVLLRLSLWLNLVLMALLIGLLLLWRYGLISLSLAKAADKGSSSSSDALLFSSYCVVFPTQGTIGEKVRGPLEDMFPGRVLEIKGGSQAADQLLHHKMEETVKSIEKADKVKQLLARLASEHSIRFKGFSATEPNEGLSAVIERGGIFTLGGSSGQQHGSLLQANGLNKVIHQAGLDNDTDAFWLLTSLRSAIVEYASLKDALTIIGSRTAYLVKVSPEEVAHKKVRTQLLSRLEKPVFISHPITELFDAVDPTADTGGGSAAYALRLDRPCYWRLAGKDDRKDVDYGKNASNDRMRWQFIPAAQRISWKPIPLTTRKGKTSPVSSFDIAVVLEGKVVVFRNQSLLLGESKSQVIEQGKSNISQVLRLKQVDYQEAIHVSRQDEQYTGTLIYSYLADQAANEKPEADDILIRSKEDFDAIRDEEDRVIDRGQ